MRKRKPWVEMCSIWGETTAVGIGSVGSKANGEEQTTCEEEGCGRIMRDREGIWSLHRSVCFLTDSYSHSYSCITQQNPFFSRSQ